MSYALMCVVNGRAFAPPCSTCSIGVSTSMNPRRCSDSRTLRTAVARVRSMSRAAGLTIRST